MTLGDLTGRVYLTHVIRGFSHSSSLSLFSHLSTFFFSSLAWAQTLLMRKVRKARKVRKEKKKREKEEQEKREEKKNN